MKPVCKPPSPLGSYSPGAHPMTGEGGPDRSCPGKSGSRTRHSGLECGDTAGRRGTTRLQVTFVGSNSLSYPIQAHQKKSEGAPIDGGSDTVCGRYIHKYIRYRSRYIKHPRSQQLRSQYTNLQVRWVPTGQAHLRWQETAVQTDPTQERSGLAPAQWSRICTAERGGTTRPQVTFVGSNSIS